MLPRRFDRDKQPAARLHRNGPPAVLTGAINSGMSGGPALDRRGLVYGVNVSLVTGQQSLLDTPLADAEDRVAPPDSADPARTVVEPARETCMPTHLM